MGCDLLALGNKDSITYAIENLKRWQHFIDKLKNNFIGYLFVIQLPSLRSPKKTTCPLDLKKNNNLIWFYFYEIVVNPLILIHLKNKNKS